MRGQNTDKAGDEMYYKSMGADLGYNILEATLVGEIEGVSINARAGSGGRAGSKSVGAVNPLLANNPYETKVKKKGERPGGPLIMGKYYFRTHEKRANWLRLVPFEENDMAKRDGFAIHGRGTRGSDGCIVPTDFNVVKQLHSLVQKREQAGKPAPILVVYAIGDFDWYDHTLAQWTSTA
jgi:hypothetical protein